MGCIAPLTRVRPSLLLALASAGCHAHEDQRSPDTMEFPNAHCGDSEFVCAGETCREIGSFALARFTLSKG
jgi:hypothetical protein